MKLGKMFLIKLVSDYFSTNCRCVLGQFSENLEINRNPQENDFELIPSKILSRKIVGKFSVNVRCIFVFLPSNKLFINRIARAVP